MTQALLAFLATAALAMAAPVKIAPNPDGLMKAMQGRRIVLLGEVHDNAAQHALRVAAVRQLVAQGARPAIAFEQFDREHQPDIERARRERPRDADYLIAQAKGNDNWRWDSYRPFVALALEYDLPIVAANLSRRDAMKVAIESWQAVFGSVTRSELKLDALPADFRHKHEEAIAEGHCNLLPSDALPAEAHAQMARDIVMARSIRPYVDRGVVLLAGNGHVRRDIGVPFWLTPDERKSVVSIGLLERDDDSSGAESAEFDAYVITERAERADPCKDLAQRLRYTSWGSSSGSGAATAANLCAAAVGTETDGSITGPSAVENIFGLKPTLGLISQDGIVPISHQQDTAGPMARSVTDVAILLSVMQTPFGAVVGQPLPSDYTQFLQPGSLQGKRIGRDVRFFDYNYFGSGIPGDEETVAFAENALDVMESLGATIVDTDTGDVFAYTDDEFTALLFEFKTQIGQYLQTLSHTNLRTLADLIAFDSAHCVQELVYYGQEIFEAAEPLGDLSDPAYIAARSHATGTARAGIDGALARDNLDAIVAPHLTNSTGPAVAGYPNFSMPVGIRSSGRPAGMLMYSTFLEEPQLIAMAYDLEQALHARQQPQFLGSIIPIPNAGLCNKPHQPQGKAHLPHGRIF